MMQVEIFDVGHGQCAVVTAPNGRRLMIDCGSKRANERFWAPSVHYHGQRFELLVLMNLDEDHVRDFPLLTTFTSIGRVWSNPTVGPHQLNLLKRDGMGPGISGYMTWLADPQNQILTLSPDFGTLSVWGYYLPYLPGLMTSTNDLSLLLFVKYGAFKIVFSGDLEGIGWNQMLNDPRIRRDVAGTNVLIASHHGREGGCSSDLFRLIRPEVVVISDDELQYESQRTDDWYRQRCTGVPLIANPTKRRYVYTTRRDGSLKIEVDQDGNGLIQPVKVHDWPAKSPQKSQQRLGSGLLPFLPSVPYSYANE
jgi:hypothetical protein